MSDCITTTITPTVHHVAGPAAGWTVLTDEPPRAGVPFTLVDAGYPGYADRVRASVAALGLRTTDLAAVVVTHAHVDHVGAVPALLREAGDEVVVATGEVEVPHLRGEVHESAGAGDVASRLLQPGVAGWAWHLLHQQALRRPVSLAVVSGVPDGTPLDVPGRPVPLTTPGHTSGHTCYLLPEHGAVVTGDALVTGHPLSRDTGPQVLPDFFHADVPGMLASLDLLAGSGAETLLPGHGPVRHQPVADACEQAVLTARAHLSRGRP